MILDTGDVKCWGRADSGELGYGSGSGSDKGDNSGEMGDSLPVVDLGTNRTAIAIAAGLFHTCAILDTANVKCWGYNEAGQCGNNDQIQRGDDLNEMGDSLPITDLGTGRTAVAITAGDIHSCAILDDGNVKCWGDSSYGQLGLGDTSRRGDGANEMGDNLPAVALGTGRTAVAIVALQHHTCVLLDNMSMKCWGWNQNGQLGQGDTNNRGDQAGEMGDSLPAIDLGTDRYPVAIAAGDLHSCALLDNAQIKCW